MMTIFKRIALIVGVLAIAMLLVALTTGIILAQGPDNAFPNFGWGHGPGMMGGGMMRGQGMMGFGPSAAITGTMPYGRGMMGGPGMMGFGPGAAITGTTPYGCGMMGGQGMGHGMMGGGYNALPQGEPITADEAKQAAEQYLAAYNDPNLVIDEVMTFSQNFYVQVAEKEGNLKALELLVDPYTGFVHPEPGPNMMWNTRYSPMAQGSQPAVEVTVTPAQASEYAQKFLDTNLPGVTVEAEVEPFPGYYTIHTLKDGQIEGMLSVNGYTGQVWYHHWHGDFIGMAEIH
jgi:hypothetical protein